MAKTFKIRMKNGLDCGLKGFEFQVVDPRAASNAVRPDSKLIPETLQKLGYKVPKVIALNYWEII